METIFVPFGAFAVVMVFVVCTILSAVVSYHFFKWLFNRDKDDRFD